MNKAQKHELASSAMDLANNQQPKYKGWLGKFKAKAGKYLKFVGPGLMVSVAYMDPGNYSTDVSAGALSEYKLLFVVLLSSCIAIFLQSLATKLGCVTGADLAVNCRQNMPKWLNYVLYVIAEAAIILTDIAEVVGMAVALNILFKIPLLAGVALTMIDVMIILIAYRPEGSTRALQIFELCVGLLVFGVVACVAAELARMKYTRGAAHLFQGFLPSKDLIKGDVMYQACGILGATVMPHSLYLGSSLVIPRLKHYDLSWRASQNSLEHHDPGKYRPSLKAIKYSLGMSIWETSVALALIAFFVNSALLIVAGTTLYGKSDAKEADLYSIYDMLQDLVSRGAAVLFMVALLLSGQSAGIVCTIAGQIVSEGYLCWTIRPWLRRLCTRLIAILPCIIITAAVGKSGLSATLNASQVGLSILLPILTAPLVWLTWSKKVMVVYTSEGLQRDMSSGWPVKIASVAVWLFITVLNVYLIVQIGLGAS